MTNELRNSLKKLSELGPQLNKASDEAASIVREIERLLQELGICVLAEEIVSRTPRSPEITDLVSLGYARVNGKYRIVVVESTAERTEWTITSTIPWLETTRELKLETFTGLPNLLQNLIQNTLRQLERIEKTKPTVDAIINSMK
jgi:hypothetical protein